MGPTQVSQADHDLFIDPMLGSPLPIYVEKDVDDRDHLVDLITKNGGAISPSYSGVPYIIVDPLKPSGQNLYRQYAAKKSKVVLSYQWIHECIKARQLHTFHTDWAGCKVTGNEQESSRRVELAPPPQPIQPQIIPELVQFPNYHPIYPLPAVPAARTWQTPQQQEPAWDYEQHMYDYRYRLGEQWPYYEQPYEEPYSQPYIQPAAADPAPAPPPPPPEPEEERRGRKRTRGSPPATASSLVVARRDVNAPPPRSPTPPTRVIKSTYGGNLFTVEDVEYLKKYIDYCRDQGLVLSLREICERIAVKAPHHTFYSWRRYCNKHQIRLDGYTMNPPDRASSAEDDPSETETHHIQVLHPSSSSLASAVTPQPQPSRRPTRSPTPPRVLFRSTTGKGVAFTQEDITFLKRFMEYRKSQALLSSTSSPNSPNSPSSSGGRIDMVAFWKDVAQKAPHHSRASWMKYWRRHKHELCHNEDEDEPLPQPPDKKMRYSKADDVLLAKYLRPKPEGTSDKVFQAFGRLHPHHPWKGWQEHHRIHKAKIDHYISQLNEGQNIDEDEMESA
ncbi:hypothetical protein VKT23_000615 [Stygiomarasmius scandens]|uniref:BRCT domain-containing protein n=1 Tax=Marasmiellus scandens TaxID=2682957 RepID=A0ABR1K4L3_9AGAR